MGPRARIRRRSAQELARSGAEIVLALGATSLVVAALQHAAPAAGLGVLYLLAVLALAIHRGELEAMLTAVLGILVLEYLFIPPRHQLGIAHAQDVVELVVLLITAGVVGRLAALGRERAAEAGRRAELAVRREREATLLAVTASTILAGSDLDQSLRRLTAEAGVRVALSAVPEPGEGDTVLPLRAGERRGWLYAAPAAGWSRVDLERVVEPLGRLVGVALERDRLAERAAESEAARRAGVARTAILHAVSHDLRSPLTAIATAAAALRTAAVTEAERSELVELIDEESRRLARLVDDLLDVSRIEAGAAEPRADWCDLRDVAVSAAAQLRDEHPIEFALPDDLPLVRADAAQLERVFSNLLENAVKHSPPGAPVRVSGRAHGGRVILRVVDRGPGIPVAQRRRVFEPFFRAPGGAGSGLGLAICRGFVQANGGQIAATSDRDGGAALTVSFPVTVQPEPEPVR